MKYTLNLIHKLTMASFNQQMIKYSQMGCGQGYVTIFNNFWDPSMVPDTSYLIFRLAMTSTQRMVNYPINMSE